MGEVPAAEGAGRTCLRCDTSLRERRIPRLFCSPGHAAQGAFAAVLVLFAAERFGLRLTLRVVRAALYFAHLRGWFGFQD
ncbi:hypothetical protein [Streptomyces sp. SID4985]|uniref:hypothetical protein n=1 Tax=unclassified Streptomyces TaxID=2593676 RepID=UPI00136F4B54|nr:hypothetical protein [Streptomyces sp. SID4985]MYQ44554.1 hypothetical protein [Streptomyces sp. SID4985]